MVSNSQLNKEVNPDSESPQLDSRTPDENKDLITTFIGSKQLTVDDLPNVQVPQPPDGGYGWVVTFAGFTLSLILDGVCFSFGLYMQEFIDYFQESKAKAAWIGSVLNGMYLSFGPIVSIMCNKFGCRSVALVGSFIAGIFICCSIFSPNLDVMIFMFGFMGGVGFGMLYLPAIVMVGYYFSSKRAFATGICVCGSGIGGLVFAPMTDFLIKEYGWQGSVLITSGLVFNCLVMSSLLRPLEALAHFPSSYKLSGVEEEVYYNNGNIPIHGANQDNTTTILLNNYQNNDIDHGYVDSKSHNWFLSLGTFNNETKSRSKSNAASNLYDSQIQGEQLAKSCDFAWQKAKVNRHKSDQFIDISRPMFQKPDPMFYLGGSTVNVTNRHSRVLSHSISSDHGAQSALGPTYELTNQNRQSHCSHTIISVRSEGNKSLSEKLEQGCADVFDVSLLSSPTFLIYGFSCFLCMMGFFIPFTFVPILATSKGFSKQDGALLISVMSGTNVIGRIIIGWVSDQSWANPVYINSVALMLGGLVTAFYPYYESMILLCIASLIFGLSIATFVSLRSIIMVQLMGLERLSAAFGLVTLCQGLSSFIGSPIAGALSDLSGRFENSFYLAGATLSFAGFITIPLICVSQWENKRKKLRGEM